jgi:hypothetical protein
MTEWVTSKRSVRHFHKKLYQILWSAACVSLWGAMKCLSHNSHFTIYNHQTGWHSDNALELFLGVAQFESQLRHQTTRTEAVHRFPQPLHENFRDSISIRSQLPHSKWFPVHQSFIILAVDAIQYTNKNVGFTITHINLFINQLTRCFGPERPSSGDSWGIHK